jgi:dihydropteroate synthase
MRLQCGRFELTLERPLVMGVLNITPDSFYEPSRQQRADAAIARAHELVAEGADLLDIGAESTRPGAQPVSDAEEWRRLAPVLEALRGLAVPLSVDTRRASTMRRALDLGADMINDVSGFADPQAIAAVAPTPAALCVMHMTGDPRTMQDDPSYLDVVGEIGAWLGARLAALAAAGVARERLVLDPGIGFGKRLGHNLALLRALPQLADAAGRALAPAGRLPVLVGLSRKSLVGELTGRPPEARLAGSLAAAIAAVARGAAIVWVHDVAATRDALAVWSALGVASVQAAGGAPAFTEISSA